MTSETKKTEPKLVEVYLKKTLPTLAYAAGKTYQVTTEEKAKLTKLGITGSVPGQKDEKED
ncbi:MAG: hypothetical protein H6546_09015 [Chitinophagales bacterium]|nr:hypothetical protein [Chitinophagales bacterium]